MAPKQQKPPRQQGAAQKKQQGNPKKEKKPPAAENEDVKREQKLQAVLLADSFTKAFRPITLETPKVLMPLVNVPMLDYTIEFLAQNGVEEIFVFCVWHADLVEAYVKSSKWISKISVKCISSTACLSAGDALREMDSLNIIRSDPFILISGDVIANLDLKKAIAFHKEKRKEDINNVMTIVMKHVQKSAGVKPVLDDLVVALDSKTSQIVLYDDAYQSKTVQIPLEILEDRSALTFQTDLLDCHLDICSAEFLMQFSDNFDYQDIRKDFIQNEVSNWALGKHIYGYLIQNEYAARVQDQRSYHTICRDIVTRWVYPFVPDGQLLCNNTYVHKQHYSYKEDGTMVARSAFIGEGVVLGAGTTVGENAFLSMTVVGRVCNIGEGAKVVDSHIWEGACIERNAKVTRSIICKGAVIGKGAVIPTGCVISFGVTIGPNVVLPEFTKVIRRSSLVDSSEGTTTAIEAGEGSLWSPPMGEDSERSRDACRTGSIGCFEDEEWKRQLWTTCEPPDESDDDESVDGAYNGEDTNECFIAIIKDMVITGNDEGHPTENLLMEIKGCKFAQNKSYSDCLAGIVPALLVIATGTNFKQGDFIKSLKTLLSSNGWGYQLVKAMVQEEEDEIAVITGIEDFVLQAANMNTSYPMFRFILQIVHESELVKEEAVCRWISMREADAIEDLEDDEEECEEDVMIQKRVRLFKEEPVQAFVKWIQVDSSDEDGSGEDECGSGSGEEEESEEEESEED